ncbi:MAG: hypothetical protein IMX04_06830 [Candidatus Carbobacillus altaicus]|nr:hypothetical protein [Candidatus Carbobacillus altaicus]
MAWIPYSTVRLLRSLIPASNFLFTERLSAEEAIFYYRNGLYFVYDDGSIVGMPRPKRFRTMTFAELWGALYRSSVVRDYDQDGVFDLGEFLQDIGYLVATPKTDLFFAFTLSPRYDPQDVAERFEIDGVSFPFALYHALLSCTRHFHGSDRTIEYIVTGIEIRKLSAKEAAPV